MWIYYNVPEQIWICRQQDGQYIWSHEQLLQLMNVLRSAGYPANGYRIRLAIIGSQAHQVSEPSGENWCRQCNRPESRCVCQEQVKA